MNRQRKRHIKINLNYRSTYEHIAMYAYDHILDPW